MTLRQIVDLKAGDVISLDLPEAVIAQVDGVPLFECHYGQKNGQIGAEGRARIARPAMNVLSHGSGASDERRRAKTATTSPPDDWAAAMAEQETATARFRGRGGRLGRRPGRAGNRATRPPPRRPGAPPPRRRRRNIFPSPWPPTWASRPPTIWT
jgi:hypothetical protein